MSVINKKPYDKWRINALCWYEENWSGLPVQARIKDILTHDAGFQYAKLECMGDHYGSTSRPLNQLFRTKEECLAAINDKESDKTKEYEEQIVTIQDLVRFGYEHTIACCEEYTDYAARNAYKNRAKVLLDLDL